MAKNKRINIEGKEITIISQNKDDYISLTDMARNQLQEVVIIKWLSLKSTIEYLGEWETLYNPDFNYTEFGIIKNTAGSNNFILSVKQWREENPNKEGNIRDFATIEQLVVLSNLESINAMLIQQGLTTSERLEQLNQIAITQIKSLIQNLSIKRLKQ